MISLFTHTVVLIFIVGDVLMTGAAVHRRIVRGAGPRAQAKAISRSGKLFAGVAVLIPAYNEDKVIARTIRSVLGSNYPNLRVIVIDDGSTDNTLEAARAAMPADLASGRLLVVTHPNGGKAEALNFGLRVRHRRDLRRH